MSKKILTAYDFGGNEIQNVRMHNLAADPATPGSGQAWTNTTTGEFKVRIGGTTKSLAFRGDIVDGDISATAGIANSKLATNPLARSNHTGTQLAATISDFDAQVRTSRLDQLATPTAAVSLNSQRATNVADPSAAQDAATKNYVDNRVAGQDWKDSVRAASTANVNIASPGATIDGVSLVVGDRVLLKNQTTGSQNGIYIWNGAATAMTRATDADTSAEMSSGVTVAVEEGGTNVDSLWILTTNNPITLGTTSLTFTQIPTTATSAGTGLTQAGNVISLTTPVTLANGGTGATTAAGARTAIAATTKYTTTISGDGAALTFNAVHNLGTKMVTVQVYDVTADDLVDVDIHRTDVNTIQIGFAVAPASGKQYDVVVVG